MKSDEYYLIDSPDTNRRLAEWAHGEMKLESIVCPVHAGHQRGGRRLTDLSITLPGKSVQDFVWTWLNELLIQDNVLELFRGSGLTGFEVKPVKARFKRAGDLRPPRLWELVVVGWGGFAPPESGFRLIRRCEACHLTKYSGCTRPDLVIDPSQWDGSDLFNVWPMAGFAYVTQRVAQVIRDNHLKGVVLKRPGDLDLSGNTNGGVLSHYLRHMPVDRAQRVREEFHRRWGVPAPD